MTHRLVPDTVCVCGHWFEEHDRDDHGTAYCEGCNVGGVWPVDHPFEFDPRETAMRIDEMEDPDRPA